MSYRSKAPLAFIISILITALAIPSWASTPPLRNLIQARVGCSALESLTSPQSSEEQLSWVEHLTVFAAFGNSLALEKLREISRLKSENEGNPEATFITEQALEAYGIAHAISQINEETSVLNPKFDPKTLPWVVIRAALGDRTFQQILERLVIKSSPWQKRVLSIYQHWDELLQILAATNLTEYANALNSLIQKEYDNLQHQFANRQITVDQTFVQRLNAFMEGPAKVAFIIDHYFRLLFPDDKINEPAKKSIHDVARRIANLLTLNLGILRNSRDPKTVERTQGSIRSFFLGRPEELLGVVNGALDDINTRLLGLNSIDVELKVPKNYKIDDFHFRLELQDILKQLINNAGKYAGNNKVLTISYDPISHLLKVSDDGNGFDLTKPREPTPYLLGRGGDGLDHVRQTAEKLGIKMSIESSPGKGTAVLLTLPKDKIQAPPETKIKT